MRKENATFNTKFISESGSYLTNSDYFAFVELKDYACYVVADGMDIDTTKESAKLAVSTVIARFSENPGMSSGKLKDYIRAAHQILLDEAQEIRLEASIVIMVTDYKKVRWVHAGNSRLYFMRNGMVKAFTKDNSLTQRMVDQEEIALDQVAFHEERNNLYSYLGQPGRFNPVVSKKRTLDDGDILLLVTRGVWENVGDAELIDAVDGVSKPDEVCMGLEDVILSQQNTVVENYTIATVFVDKVYQNPKAGRNKKILKIVLIIVILLFSIFGTMFISRAIKNRNNVEKMEKSKEKGITYLHEVNYASAAEQFDKACDIAENIKARPSSKNGIKVSIVENYDSMMEYTMLAMNAINEKNYKEASVKLNNAVTVMNRLKDEYEQDIDYLSSLVKYKAYADAMLSGENALATKNYSEAFNQFESAANTMNAVGDVANENVAKAAENEAFADMHIATGDDFFNTGKSDFDKKDWIQAKKHFENALDSYTEAKDKTGSQIASEKAMQTQQYIDDCEDNISDDDKAAAISAGLDLQEQARAAAVSGDINQAKDLYNQAMEKFQEAGEPSYILALEEEMKKLDIVPEAEVAEENFYKGVTSLAENDIVKALKYFGTAKENYEKAKDTAMVSYVDDLIVKITTRTTE